MSTEAHKSLIRLQKALESGTVPDDCRVGVEYALGWLKMDEVFGFPEWVEKVKSYEPTQ